MYSHLYQLVHGPSSWQEDPLVQRAAQRELLVLLEQRVRQDPQGLLGSLVLWDRPVRLELIQDQLVLQVIPDHLEILLQDPQAPLLRSLVQLAPQDPARRALSARQDLQARLACQAQPYTPDQPALQGNKQDIRATPARQALSALQVWLEYPAQQAPPVILRYLHLAVLSGCSGAYLRSPAKRVL